MVYAHDQYKLKLQRRMMKKKQVQFDSKIMVQLGSLYQILVARMGKKVNQKKSDSCEGRWCQKHHFQIKPFLIMLKNPKECSIRLCPHFNRQRKLFQSPIPALNNDRKFYTPLFVLEEDQKLYVDHDKSNFRSFQNSKISEEYQISQIVRPTSYNSLNCPFFFTLIIQMVPKVGSSNSYCKVCREDYSDYLQHVESQRHRELIGAHPYSTFIAELVDNFKPTNFEQKAEIIREPREKPLQSIMEEQLQCQGLQKQTGLRLRQSDTQKMEAEIRF